MTIQWNGFVVAIVRFHFIQSILTIHSHACVLDLSWKCPNNLKPPKTFIISALSIISHDWECFYLNVLAMTNSNLICLSEHVHFLFNSFQFCETKPSDGVDYDRQRGTDYLQEPRRRTWKNRHTEKQRKTQKSRKSVFSVKFRVWFSKN